MELDQPRFQRLLGASATGATAAPAAARARRTTRARAVPHNPPHAVDTAAAPSEAAGVGPSYASSIGAHRHAAARAQATSLPGNKRAVAPEEPEVSTA